jgi:signal transduction histidine kinase/CheY-like chemotaxis protein
MLGANHEIIVSNPAVPRILGYGQKPWNLSDIEHDLSASMDLVANCEEAARTKHSMDFNEVMFGSKILRLSLTPVLAKALVIGTVLLMEDITEAKVLERSRDEFFSIASHELRTPLTAIKGNSSMILQYYGETMKDHSLHGMVDDIYSSSVRLIEIVNDFLDMSRLEQGKISFKLQPVALDKILEQVFYEMGPVLKQKKLFCKISGNATRLNSLPLIQADPDRTKQIIYNLIGNAAKFTEKGGITVHAEVVGDHMKVSVTDTGGGIPVANQKLLFRKFQQAASSILTRDTTRGTGLGLYISRLLAEGMDGEVGLESSVPGEGTTFFFTLPLALGTKRLVAAKLDIVKPAKKTAAVGTLVHKRILIIEDDPYVQKLYVRLFERDEWQTDLANDGEEGLAKVAATKPDLILLDIMMPKLNGLDTLERLKHDKATRHIPVIILTNNGESDTIDKAKSLGAAGYFIKSDFAPDQLHEEVKGYLVKQLPKGGD